MANPKPGDQNYRGPVHESFRDLKKAIGATNTKSKSKKKVGRSPSPSLKPRRGTMHVRPKTLKRMNDPKFRSQKPADPRNKKRTVSKSSQEAAAKRVTKKRRQKQGR